MSNATAPILDSLAPSIADFRPPLHSFILHNANQTEREVMFNSNLFTIPPAHVVGPRAGVDADGDPIPGTTLVQDVYYYDPDLKEELLVVDARRTVRHVLGITRTGDGKHAEAKSSFALGGISLLPDRPQKSIVSQVAAEGSKRAFTAQISWAEQVVQAVDEGNAKRKAAGMDPVHGGPEYMRAQKLLNKYHELMSKEADAVITAHNSESEEMELELETLVRAKAMELAERASKATGVDKLAIFKEMMGDPAWRAKLKHLGYSVRKKGFREPTEEELQVAAEMQADADAFVPGGPGSKSPAPPQPISQPIPAEE